MSIQEEEEIAQDALDDDNLISAVDNVPESDSLIGLHFPAAPDKHSPGTGMQNNNLIKESKEFNLLSGGNNCSSLLIDQNKDSSLPIGGNNDSSLMIGQNNVASLLICEKNYSIFTIFMAP